MESACGATKHCNFNIKEIYTCVECQSIFSKGHQKYEPTRGLTDKRRKGILYRITFSTGKELWAVEVV